MFRFPVEGAISLVALAMLGALIWFGGDVLGIDPKIRMLVIGCVVTLAVFIWLIGRLMAARGARRIENQLRMQAQAQMESVTPDKQPEVAELEKQFRDALGSLKASKMGATALYTLPWYIIIGPPGAGKSTALQESGLNFPNVGGGPKSIRGIGGTRNCDWWFTDEGILLDTAGRYTTQAEDQHEWFAFLDLLKKSRKHKPINGAIVAVSVTDLVSATSEEIEAHAKTIRDRLDELTKQLNLVFPVYLMFTKCDLLSGFGEFFEDYARPERSQVWGYSLPYSGSQKEARQSFEEESGALAAKLRLRRLGVLANDRPVKKRQSSFAFPLQFEKARKPLAEFVGALFKANPFAESAVLRGVYFSSGTQKGIPIDQVLAALGEAFQMTEEATTLQQTTTEKKSFFLKDLFTKVIFPDQNLARSSANVLRNQAVVRTVAAVASLGLFVIVLAYLVTSFIGNQGLVGGMDAALNRVAAAQKINAGQAEQLAALDELRGQLAGIDGYRRGGAPITLGFGLYRGEDVAQPGRKVYDAQMKALLMNEAAKKLVTDLEELRVKPEKKSSDYDDLYDMQRTWKMLTGELKPAEPELIERVMKKNDRWVAGLNPRTPESEKVALSQLSFVATQLDRVGDFKLAYDPALDQRVSDELTGALWIPQTYEAVINNKKDSFDAINVDYLIKGSPAKSLIKTKYTFSGIYTQSAWDKYVAFAIKEQSNVLSSKFAQLKAEKKPSEIEERLRDQYVTEYRRNWDLLLENVSVEEFADCQDAVNRLRQLTAADAPHRELFRSIWAGRVLKLSESELPRNKPMDDLKWVDEALKALTNLMGELDTFVRATQPQKRVIRYHQQNKLKALVDVFDKCAKDLDIALNAADPTLSKRALKVLMDVWDNARKALAKEAQAEADALWQTSVVQWYRDNMAGKFPFEELDWKTRQDATLDSFIRMFRPKSGIFWGTYETLDALDDYVISQPLISFSPDFKACVAKAQHIRTTMFKPDTEAFNVPFTVKFDGSKGVADIRLGFPGMMYNGNKLDIGLNDRESRRFEPVWTDGPGQGAKLSIRVGDNQWVVKDYTDKAWGLLRLLREGKPTGVDQVSFVNTWMFQTLVAGKEQTFDVKLTFTCKEAESPLKEKYFAGFLPPAKIGQ
ncbi:MAG: type VI secretion system membrane subunit TssM [Planctomycetes bacterium]|nr:type VI secretion system membrane subunit TssM [Planctomycetota bacterium]